MQVAQEPNPTAARRELALYFRTLREQRKYGLDDLAKYLEVTEAQASRLDRGARGLRPDDVRKLAEWYQLPEIERDRLLALADESRRRGWWQQVELDGAYRTLIGMEQAAHAINEYCTSVIPGLLQTEEYARAATIATVPEALPDQVDLVVEVRMRRQQVLERTTPPRLWIVIDEGTLLRKAGGDSVMRRQLEHLIASADRPEIEVQVIGFEYGVHPGINSQFIIVDTSGALPDLVYVEGLRGVIAEKDSPEIVARYRKTWDTLRAIALSPRDSRARLIEYLGRFTP